MGPRPHLAPGPSCLRRTVNEIKVEAVSPKNVNDVLKIEVSDDQVDFVPSIESSIELARKYEDACCCAVRVGDTVCGFGLYGIDQETGNWKIYRLVIDRRFQGRGIGKEALGQILDILRNGYQAREVLSLRIGQWDCAQTL